MANELTEALAAAAVPARQCSNCERWFYDLDDGKHREGYFGARWHICDQQAVDGIVEKLNEQDLADGSVMRGILASLGFETAVLLLAFGALLFWRYCGGF